MQMMMEVKSFEGSVDEEVEEEGEREKSDESLPDDPTHYGKRS